MTPRIDATEIEYPVSDETMATLREAQAAGPSEEAGVAGCEAVLKAKAEQKARDNARPAYGNRSEARLRLAEL